MKTAFNAFLWTLFVCIVGAAQIGIAYLYTYFSGKNPGGLTKFYSEGFFLFFSISLIAGIFYEFQFESKCRISKPVKNLLLISSAGIGIFAMVTYALAFSARISPDFSLDNYVSAQNYITSLTVMVSITMKGIIYKSK